MRILKIKDLYSVKEGWCDKDTIMLFACFQLLEEFIELEKGDTDYNYEIYKDVVDEMRFLYDWWKVRKSKPHKNFTIEDEIEDEEKLIRLMKIRKYLWV